MKLYKLTDKTSLDNAIRNGKNQMNKNIDTIHNMRDMWGDKIRPKQAAEIYFKDHPDKRYVIVDGTMDTVVFARRQGQALHGDFVRDLKSNRRIWRARR